MNLALGMFSWDWETDAASRSDAAAMLNIGQLVDLNKTSRAQII